MATEDTPRIPVFQEYMNPILDALRRRGGRLAIEDLDRAVVEDMKLSTEVCGIPHEATKPDRSEISYRMAWSRTFLKKAGLLETPERGVWALTTAGASAGDIDARALASQVTATYVKDTDAPAAEPAPPPGDDEELTTARVNETLARELLAIRDELAGNGALLAPEVAARYLRRFRDEFGPEVLSTLDGEALLLKMHGRGTKNSLVYWLEFKDDDEFPAKFGSIAGGNALKFGIYQNVETGRWMGGTSREQVVLELDDAIARARGQRDQLVAAAIVFASYAGAPEAADYAAIQKRVVQAAPDIAETSWGHKYLSLLFPQLIEPFHGAEYEQHQLFKILKLPGEGRYQNARIFAGIARQLCISLLDLGTTLHVRNGGPHAYWRVGTTLDDKSEWPRMQAGGFAAVGWPGLGDLGGVEYTQQGKAQLRAAMEAKYPGAANVVTKATNQLFQFVCHAQPRDIILAMEGNRVRGIGRVTGDYFFKLGDGPFPHRRNVEWLPVGEWKLPEQEGLLTTFIRLGKHPVNIVNIEARILGQGGIPLPQPAHPPGPPNERPVAPPLPGLSGVVARINAVLQRKRQVILYGPPGTGKTYWAQHAVEELASRAWFGRAADQLSTTERAELLRGRAIETCSFHPAYGYEDFLEGYRPIASGAGLTFELRDGIFKRLCRQAAKRSDRPFFLLIDEINRGDVPRIFGELLTVLEKDKRNRPVTLPLSGEAFAVPDNVFVLGTMNTADRSIALLDAALRRRFGFVELLPDATVLGASAVGGLPLGPWLDELNRRVVRHAGRDARHLQVGHSYLLSGASPIRDLGRFAEVLRDDIIPLLEEYCYEDFDALEKILGSTLVIRAKRRIDESLFDSARHVDLVQALLSSFDMITATKQAVAADVEEPQDVSDEDDSDAVASASS
ncbi:MAG: winged helix-turn-helix domain-containing protein [Minicystis sp.]